MRVERVELDDPRLADYRVVRDPALVRRSGRFLAEGRLVVRTLLTDSPLRACSVLCDDAGLEWLRRTLGDRVPAGLPVYRLEGGLRGLGGWNFHQGCLALGERPAVTDVVRLLAARPSARLVVGHDEVSNPDNVGAIVRSAAAFAADAMLLSPGCASPLYRKALRTSMGQALRLPFAHGSDWAQALASLRAAGFALLALAPGGGAEPLERVCRDLPSDRPRALLLGAEGSGLGAASLEQADRRVAIPMPGGIDSLNVAAAAAVALYRLAPSLRPADP